jgi:F0F1-type ATP synthase delta subunit
MKDRSRLFTVTEEQKDSEEYKRGLDLINSLTEEELSALLTEEVLSNSESDTLLVTLETGDNE